MRERLTTLLELVGLAAVTAGATLIYVPAGFITGGVLAVGVGVLLALPRGLRGEGEQ